MQDINSDEALDVDGGGCWEALGIMGGLTVSAPWFAGGGVTSAVAGTVAGVAAGPWLVAGAAVVGVGMVIFCS